MTDLVEVHGRDPHLPALLPPYPPSARVAAKQCCATLHKRLQSCKLFRVPFLFPNATHENAFSISQTFARSPLLFWRERHCRLLALHFVSLCTASSRMGCKRTHCPQEGRHRRGNDGCFANVTCTEHVTIVCTSRPAGNDIGEHSFKLNNIFVGVRDPNIHVFWFGFEFSRKTVARFALAECLLTFMVADTLHIYRMKTFPVDIIIFVLWGGL